MTPSTGKDGVWFKTEGILNCTSLILEIQGVKEDVHVDILMALDGEDNGYDEKCPDDLVAPNDLEGISGVSSEDPIPSSAYFWTAQASAIYYVHVTSASGDSDAKFEMTLRGEPRYTRNDFEKVLFEGKGINDQNDLGRKYR